MTATTTTTTSSSHSSKVADTETTAVSPNDAEEETHLDATQVVLEQPLAQSIVDLTADMNEETEGAKIITQSIFHMLRRMPSLEKHKHQLVTTEAACLQNLNPRSWQVLSEILGAAMREHCPDLLSSRFYKPAHDKPFFEDAPDEDVVLLFLDAPDEDVAKVQIPRIFDQKHADYIFTAYVTSGSAGYAHKSFWHIRKQQTWHTAEFGQVSEEVRRGSAVLFYMRRDKIEVFWPRSFREGKLDTLRSAAWDRIENSLPGRYGWVRAVDRASHYRRQLMVKQTKNMNTLLKIHTVLRTPLRNSWRCQLIHTRQDEVWLELGYRYTVAEYMTKRHTRSLGIERSALLGLALLQAVEEFHNITQLPLLDLNIDNVLIDVTAAKDVSIQLFDFEAAAQFGFNKVVIARNQSYCLDFLTQDGKLRDLVAILLMVIRGTHPNLPWMQRTETSAAAQLELKKEWLQRMLTRPYNSDSACSQRVKKRWHQPVYWKLAACFETIQQQRCTSVVIDQMRACFSEMLKLKRVSELQQVCDVTPFIRCVANQHQQPFATRRIHVCPHFWRNGSCIDPQRDDGLPSPIGTFCAAGYHPHWDEERHVGDTQHGPMLFIHTEWSYPSGFAHDMRKSMRPKAHIAAWPKSDYNANNVFSKEKQVWTVEEEKIWWSSGKRPLGCSKQPLQPIVMEKVVNECILDALQTKLSIRDAERLFADEQAATMLSHWTVSTFLQKLDAVPAEDLHFTGLIKRWIPENERVLRKQQPHRPKPKPSFLHAAPLILSSSNILKIQEQVQAVNQDAEGTRETLATKEMRQFHTSSLQAARWRPELMGSNHYELVTSDGYVQADKCFRDEHRADKRRQCCVSRCISTVAKGESTWCEKCSAVCHSYCGATVASFLRSGTLHRFCFDCVEKAESPIIQRMCRSSNSKIPIALGYVWEQKEFDTWLLLQYGRTKWVKDSELDGLQKKAASWYQQVVGEGQARLALGYAFLGNERDGVQMFFRGAQPCGLHKLRVTISDKAERTRLELVNWTATWEEKPDAMDSAFGSGWHSRYNGVQQAIYSAWEIKSWNKEHDDAKFRMRESDFHHLDPITELRRQTGWCEEFGEFIEELWTCVRDQAGRRGISMPSTFDSVDLIRNELNKYLKHRDQGMDENQPRRNCNGFLGYFAMVQIFVDAEHGMKYMRFGLKTENISVHNRIPLQTLDALIGYGDAAEHIFHAVECVAKKGAPDNQRVPYLVAVFRVNDAAGYSAVNEDGVISLTKCPSTKCGHYEDPRFFSPVNQGLTTKHYAIHPKWLQIPTPATSTLGCSRMRALNCTGDELKHLFSAENCFLSRESEIPDGRVTVVLACGGFLWAMCSVANGGTGKWLISKICVFNRRRRWMPHNASHGCLQNITFEHRTAQSRQNEVAASIGPSENQDSSTPGDANAVDNPHKRNLSTLELHVCRPTKRARMDVLPSVTLPKKRRAPTLLASNPKRRKRTHNALEAMDWKIEPFQRAQWQPFATALRRDRAQLHFTARQTQGEVTVSLMPGWLGKGATATVWLSELQSKSSGVQQCAIKLNKSASMSQIKKLMKERDVLRKLASSKYVVNLVDDGLLLAEGNLICAYLLLERAASNLSLKGDPRRPWGWPNGLVYAMQVVRGLQHMHGLGVVHGDIKPSNIVMMNEPNVLPLSVKIVDFDGAYDRTRARGEKESKKRFFGTSIFASLRVHDLVEFPIPADDLWSLFFCALEWTCDGLPWRAMADKLQKKNKSKHAGTKRRTAIREAKDEFIRKCLRGSLDLPKEYGEMVQLLSRCGEEDTLHQSFTNTLQKAINSEDCGNYKSETVSQTDSTNDADDDDAKTRPARSKAAVSLNAESGCASMGEAVSNQSGVKHKKQGKLLFIHSGRTRCGTDRLGDHYLKLFKRKMWLVPIDEYEAMTPLDQEKYRPLEGLESGNIVAIALFDRSFMFQAEHAKDPWAHGPFCWHIHGHVMLPEPVPFSAQQGQCPTTTKAKKLGSALASPSVSRVLKQWSELFEFEDEDFSFADLQHHKTPKALTVYQPFCEAICRGEKTFENRTYNIKRVRDRSSEVSERTCRTCMKKAPDSVSDKDACDATRNALWNQRLSKLDLGTKVTAGLTMRECKCREKNEQEKEKRSKRKKDKDSNKTTTEKQKKTPKKKKKELDDKKRKKKKKTPKKTTSNKHKKQKKQKKKKKRLEKVKEKAIVSTTRPKTTSDEDDGRNVVAVDNNAVDAIGPVAVDNNAVQTQGISASFDDGPNKLLSTREWNSALGSEDLDCRNDIDMNMAVMRCATKWLHDTIGNVKEWYMIADYPMSCLLNAVILKQPAKPFRSKLRRCRKKFETHDVLFFFLNYGLNDEQCRVVKPDDEEEGGRHWELMIVFLNPSGINNIVFLDSNSNGASTAGRKRHELWRESVIQLRAECLASDTDDENVVLGARCLDEAPMETVPIFAPDTPVQTDTRSCGWHDLKYVQTLLLWWKDHSAAQSRFLPERYMSFAFDQQAVFKLKDEFWMAYAEATGIEWQPSSFNLRRSRRHRTKQ